MNILQEIVNRTKERIAAQKKALPLEKLIERTERYIGGTTPPPNPNTATGFPFEAALRRAGVSLICEIKRASPSKGMIAEDFPYLEIAREYEEAGADAVSVLTEPYFFKGDNRYLREISDAAAVPLLRKDFVIDPYMLYEAKILGASAVLLICAALNGDELAEFISLTHGLKMSALVETRDEREVETALSSGARIIGVNNRDLKTFEVDMAVSERLRKLVPPDVLFVSESGIKTPGDIAKLRAIGADAALIGETIMRSADKRGEIARLKEAAGTAARAL